MCNCLAASDADSPVEQDAGPYAAQERDNGDYIKGWSTHTALICKPTWAWESPEGSSVVLGGPKRGTMEIILRVG